jgi:hypothetical protein
VTPTLPWPVVASASILRLVAPEQDEQAAIGSCMLDGNHHQGLDKLAEHDFAGDSLRSLDYCPEIKLLDGRVDHGGGRGLRSFLVQTRVFLTELPHLAERAPTEVAVAGISEIGIRARLIAAG